MKRKIFIGSSTKGLREIHRILEPLSHLKDIECVPWTRIFDPTSVIIQSLEQVLSQCTGAIFIATPDDRTNLNRRWVNAPRENVMLEFGLMAARLGRPSVAICHFGDVELPTDLAGVEVISWPKHRRPRASIDSSREAPEQRLKTWALRLLATAESIPRTEISHGYTGTWRFELVLERWRDIEVKAPSFAVFEGYLHLLIPSDGRTGTGVAEGRLTFEFVDRRKSYGGEYRVSHKVSSASCDKEGGLSFQSALFCAQVMSGHGKRPRALESLGKIAEELEFTWKLAPDPNSPRTLAGSFQTTTGGYSKGILKRVSKIT